jgi:transposase
VTAWVKAGEAVMVCTDEWAGYSKLSTKYTLTHKTVCHSAGEWARDDDGDGIREVHCNSCEGGGTGLRNYLRPFRGVNKENLYAYVATYETMFNAKRISAKVIRRMCFKELRFHSEPS